MTLVIGGCFMTGKTRLETYLEILTNELATKTSSDLSEVFALQRYQSRARKRARLPGNDLDGRAIVKFVSLNMRTGHDYITAPPDVMSNARYFIQVALERYTARVAPAFVQETLDLPHLMSFWRFGPGASNEVTGSHPAVKIDQDMTCTARCEPLVRLLRGTHPYLQYNDVRKGVRGSHVIQGSRLSTVPKNEDTVRTIAIEPSGNMAIQLAAGYYLEEVLRSIGLDIRTQQPKNKRLAQLGSIDGSLATIDLSSASDMISCNLVRSLMPRRWYNLLMDIRSPSIKLPNGEWHDLNMISTMGNGFTFPLMTLILASLIYGYRAVHNGPNLRIDWTHTAVFGDDIIVPTAEAVPIMHLLQSVGLIVNFDKSYCEGPFRESCGGDFHLGTDVTPVYVKSLQSDSEIYVAINQLLDWTGRHKYLPLSYLYLVSCLKKGPYFVPEWRNPDEGILIQSGPRRYKYLSTVTREHRYDGLYAMTLVCGGYLTDRNGELFYAPRDSLPRKRTRSSRIPKGFLDGWDPRKRSRRLSDRIADFVSYMA